MSQSAPSSGSHTQPQSSTRGTNATKHPTEAVQTLQCLQTLYHASLLEDAITNVIQRHHRLHAGQPNITVLVESMGLTHQKIRSGLTTVSSPVIEQRHKIERQAIHTEDQATLWGRHVRQNQDHGSAEGRNQAHKDWKASVDNSAEAWTNLAKIRFEDDEEWQDQLLGLQACVEDGVDHDEISQACEKEIVVNGQNGKPGL